LTPCVFIHTNDRQRLGAVVAEYAIRRNSRHPDAFDVRILRREDHPFFDAHEGQRYLRDRRWRVWRNADLQSFTPLRFLPPALMGYSGRALVMDPDIFAQGDVWELLSRDMGGKAILCRRRSGWKMKTCFASSVMLLDCAKLAHWRCEEDFGRLFTFERDYVDWMWLLLEPPGSVGELGEEWNHFDTLDARTKLLHNTHRRWQPWKTGLPADFTPRGRHADGPQPLLARLADRMRGRRAGPRGRYKPHPDPAQERFFFGLLRECLDRGVISRDVVESEVARGHVRRDALALAAGSCAPSAAAGE